MWQWLRCLFIAVIRRTQFEREMLEELRFHVEARAAELTAKHGLAADAIIVNEVVAKRYWPTESPLNKRLRTGNRSWRVVGVSGSVKEFGLGQESPAMVYTPIGRTPGEAVSILIRCNLRLTELAPAIRHEIASIDKDFRLNA